MTTLAPWDASQRPLRLRHEGQQHMEQQLRSEFTVGQHPLSTCAVAAEPAEQSTALACCRAVAILHVNICTQHQACVQHSSHPRAAPSATVVQLCADPQHLTMPGSCQNIATLATLCRAAVCSTQLNHSEPQEGSAPVNSMRVCRLCQQLSWRNHAAGSSQLQQGSPVPGPPSALCRQAGHCSHLNLGDL